MPKDEDYSSLAYTVRFTSGNMKGKTPAEIIHEDPDWKNKLNKHYEFLKKNLQQYPRNQLQLDAILDASKLQKKGQLVKKERKTISSFQIYESGFRPLIRRQKQTNKGTLSFVYQIWINWNFQMKAPVCIEIENFWAPVIQNKQGLLNVQAEQKEDTIKSSFNLSIDEWLWAMHEVKSNISIFEQKYGSPAYDEAEAAEERKRNSIAK